MNLLTSSEKKQHLMHLGFVYLALFTSLMYDWLIFQQAKGLGFLVFVVIFCTAFITMIIITKKLQLRWPLLLLIPILILSLDVFIFNNNLVSNYVPLVVYLLLLIFVILITLQVNGKKFFFRNIPILKDVTAPFEEWGRVLRDLFRSRGDKHHELYKKIVLGLVVALPLLLIFTLLFNSADAVFAGKIEGMGIWLSGLFNVKPVLVWRILRTLVMSLYIASVFYVLIGDKHILSDDVRVPHRQDPVVVGIILGLVNVLFLLFVFIQIKYLFGSPEYVINNNLTFADYARRGFFELVWVMVIAGLLLLATFRSFAHHGHVKLIQVFKMLLIAQILVIAVSALKRMNIYQDAYGFTTLRLYVEWFIYFTGVCFITLAVALLTNWKFQKFFYFFLVFGLAAFTLVASLNVDAMIANKNIEQAKMQNKPLDIHYLFGLSVDAIPAIKLALDQNIELKTYQWKADWVSLLKDVNIKNAEDQLKSWRGWNVGVARAVIFER